MKRILLGLILALCVSNANAQSRSSLCYTSNGSNCIPAIQASNSSLISIAAATTTEIIPLSSNSTIFITSWDVMAAGNGNFTLVYGTGVNCGTGTTSLTGAYPLIAQAGISKGTGLGVVLALPKGNALCATTSSSVLFAGSVSYVKF